MFFLCVFDTERFEDAFEIWTCEETQFRLGPWCKHLAELLCFTDFYSVYAGRITVVSS